MKKFDEWISSISQEFIDKEINEITLSLILKLIFFNGLDKKEIFNMKIRDIYNDNGKLVKREANNANCGIPIDKQTILLIKSYLLFLKDKTNFTKHDRINIYKIFE